MGIESFTESIIYLRKYIDPNVGRFGTVTKLKNIAHISSCSIDANNMIHSIYAKCYKHPKPFNSFMRYLILFILSMRSLGIECIFVYDGELRPLLGYKHRKVNSINYYHGNKYALVKKHWEHFCTYYELHSDNREVSNHYFYKDVIYAYTNGYFSDTIPINIDDSNIVPLSLLELKKVIEPIIRRLKIQCIHKHIKLSNSQMELMDSTILALGSRYIVSNCHEAEKLVSQLVIDGIVDVCISNDTDVFLYGASRIIRYMDFTNIKRDITYYELNDLLHSLRITEHSFKMMCILLGTDYSMFIPNKDKDFIHSRILRLYHIVNNELNPLNHTECINIYYNDRELIQRVYNVYTKTIPFINVDSAKCVTNYDLMLRLCVEFEAIDLLFAIISTNMHKHNAIM